MTIPLAKRPDEDDTTVSQSGATTNINQTFAAAPVLTGASNQTAMGDGSGVLPPNEHWVNSHWRPVAGWTYLFLCLCDFFLFPIAWSLLQAKFSGQVTAMWQPLTLQGGGLFHVAFGALLGITSYGRTKEKMGGFT